MFGVGAYTANLARSMEIITFLNTNSDFRNLLQYGIEGVNYRILESGKLERYNHNYMMDLHKTGNIFIAYPEEDMELDAWEWARKQNLDAGIYPTVGFKFDKNDPVDEELISIIAGYSAEVEKEIAACKTVEELSALFENYKTKYNGTRNQIKKASATQVQKYVYHMSRQDDPSEETGLKREHQSPFAYYWSWLEEKGFIEHA
jgi:putative aldouronate transport system substrate-binding protein